MHTHESHSAGSKAHRRKSRMFVAVAILLAACLPASGQTQRDNTGRAGNDEETRRQVLATDDKRVQALRQADPEPLRDIYADDYTLVTPSGVVRSKEDQISDLISGQVQYKKIDTTNRTIRVYGDVAIVLSRDKYEIIQAGKQVGGDVLFTRTYKRFGNVWRVIATQGTFVTQ